MRQGRASGHTVIGGVVLAFFILGLGGTSLFRALDAAERELFDPARTKVVFTGRKYESNHLFEIRFYPGGNLFVLDSLLPGSALMPPWAAPIEFATSSGCHHVSSLDLGERRCVSWGDEPRSRPGATSW